MSANQPTAAWSGPGDPLVVVSGHLVSPEDNFGEIGRMPNGNLRRPNRIEAGNGGIHSTGNGGQVITRFGNAAPLNMRRANGSEAIPTAVLSGEALTSINHQGHDGTAFATGARIRAVAAENWAVGAHGTEQTFFTTPLLSATPVARWTVQAPGHLVAASDGVVDLGQPGVNRPRDGHFSRNVVVAGIIERPTDDGALQITGHNASGGGGNVVLFGGAHATQASDVSFREGTDVRMTWDASAGAWFFPDLGAGTGELTVGAADSAGVGFREMRVPN